MKQQRIYLVGHGQTMRLVRASHRQQAVGHVARSIINAKVASQDELVEALSKGIVIEKAVAPEQVDLVDALEQETQGADVTA